MQKNNAVLKRPEKKDTTEYINSLLKWIFKNNVNKQKTNNTTLGNNSKNFIFKIIPFLSSNNDKTIIINGIITNNINKNINSLLDIQSLSYQIYHII